MGVILTETDHCGQAMPVQTAILAAFGLLPAAVGSKFRSIRVLEKVAQLPSLFFILGGLSLCLVQVIIIIYDVFVLRRKFEFKLEMDSTVRMLTGVTYAVPCLRCSMVLMFLAKHRHAWGKLVKRANAVIQKICLHDVTYGAFSQAWRKTSIVAAILTLLTILTMDCLSWTTEFLRSSNTSWTSKNALAPLPVQLPVYAYFTIWMTFYIIPFFLSMQVCCCLLIFGKIMRDSVKVMNQKLENMIEIAKTDQEEIQLGTGFTDTSQRCAATTKSVEAIIVLHLEIVHFSDALNSFFGGLFCAAYSLDLLTLICFVISLLDGTVKTPGRVEIFENVTGAAIYCVYCIAFYIPLITSYEQGIKFNQSFSRLSNALLPMSRTSEGKTLFTLLQIFADGNTEPLIEFNGAELIHVTRVFVVKTFAFTASMGVIAYRIISKEREGVAKTVKEAAEHLKDTVPAHDVHNLTLAIIAHADAGHIPGY